MKEQLEWELEALREARTAMIYAESRLGLLLNKLAETEQELQRFRAREPLVKKLLEDLLDVEGAHAPTSQIESIAQAVRDFDVNPH